MAMCYDRFIAAGGKLKEANKFSNVIHPSLIKVDAEKLVLDQFPPPELHLLIGVVNRLMDIVIIQVGLEWVENFTKSVHIIRRGYHGGGYDGNNSKKLLDNIDIMANQLPIHCLPVVSALRAFKPVVSGCFGKKLDPNFEELIENFRRAYELVQVDYMVKHMQYC
jgi:hypothetical protein